MDPLITSLNNGYFQVFFIFFGFLEVRSIVELDLCESTVYQCHYL